MKIFLIIVTIITVVLAGRWRRADDNDIFTLTPNGTEQACKTRNGLDGICVPESQCTEDHVIALYGVIDDSDLRAGNCPGFYDWCCTLESDTNKTKLPLKITEGCIVPKENDCPYCVGLYRKGGNPRTRSPSGLYCGGVLLGSKIVLTSAGCAIATKIDHIWVQIPAATNRNYTIKSLIKHPQFNSGTRENDLALMILTENVQKETQNLQGACLDFKTPLASQCTSAGFDKDEKLVLTKLEVTVGSCTSRGSTLDVSCGQAASCTVSYGSPVLCPYDGSNQLIVAGISRQTCTNGAVNLGSLTSSTTWLVEELTRNGLPGQNYTINV